MSGPWSNYGVTGAAWDGQFVNRRAFLAGVAALLAWPRRKPKPQINAHIGAGFCWPANPLDYEGRMLERLAAGLPTGPPSVWDQPDPPWLADPNWTDSV